MKKITVLLPALNEEKTISEVISSIPTIDNYEIEVVVIDGHSRDRTLEIAEEMGAICLRQPNFGKGDAVKYALKQLNPDYLFMLDADATYNPKYINTIIPILEEGKYDIVTGSRMLGTIEEGAMSRFNYIGNKILTLFTNIFYRQNKTTDLCTGLWGFSRHALDTLKFELEAEQFDIEAEMYAKACKLGLKTTEIPIFYTRSYSMSKLMSTKDGWIIFKRLIKEIT